MESENFEFNELTKPMTINDAENQPFRKTTSNDKTNQRIKTKGKIVLDYAVNFVLPAIDECTDLYSGIRYLVYVIPYLLT